MRAPECVVDTRRGALHRLGIAVAVLSLATPLPTRAEEAAELVRAAVDEVCAAAAGAPPAGARVLDTEPLRRGAQVVGERVRRVLESGAELTVERIAPGGALRRVSVEYAAPAPGGARPLLMGFADGHCRLRGGRRLLRRADGSVEALQALDADLRPLGEAEPLDAPVPEGEDPGGVIVAMVDSGVNYLLPSIASRLARTQAGESMGYDWWDMDPRPFDAHPRGSPFFVQRHGTQTASLMLAEAPVARLLPYRYPRPDMQRMRELLAHADARGVRIVNLSLGGPHGEEWRAFEAAARERPHMLFIASAGNDGRDIDAEPVWPAALELENLVVVTSADEEGRLAEGSNWGARSVDLLVPAELQVATGFDGHARIVSGSSYAAARLSALAACLLAAEPGRAAAELRARLYALAGPPPAGGIVAVGALGDPALHERGACPAEPAAPQVTAAAAQVVAGGTASPRLLLQLSLLRVEGSGRERNEVRDALARANDLLGQCAVRIEQVHYRELGAPRRLRHYSSRWSPVLMALTPPTRPAVFLVDDTLERVAFEAEAIGRGNVGRRRELVDTVWITADADDLGLVLAHELVHLLADSGAHAEDPANLMHADTRRTQGLLEESQCRRIEERGLATGLLRRAGK